MIDMMLADPKICEQIKPQLVPYDPETLTLHWNKARSIDLDIVPFDISPIANYYVRYHHDFHLNDEGWESIVDVVRPPFQVNFFEFACTDEMRFAYHERIQRVGTIVNYTEGHDQETRRALQETTRRHWNRNMNEGWIDAPLPEEATRSIYARIFFTTYLQYDRVRLMPVANSSIMVNSDWRPIMVVAHRGRKAFPLQFGHYLDGIDPSLLGAGAEHMSINPALLAISMLNTKNVSPVVIPAKEVPAKVAQKRMKKSGREPLVYRTLSITPMGGGSLRRDNAERHHGDAEARRMHIARGHFKRFTSDAPLFGKHVGTYWWNSQVRGSIESGAVSKDYKIKSPKEQS